MKEARDLEDSHPRPPQELKIPDVGNLLRKDISTSCHVCWCALSRKKYGHMTPGTNQKSPAVPPLHAANPDVTISASYLSVRYCQRSGSKLLDLPIIRQLYFNVFSL